MRRSRMAIWPQPRVPGGWRAGLVVGLSIGVTTFGLAGPALADTTIGFDDLATGAVVTNQYSAQGLSLGSASDFGQQSAGAGDCGPPQVGSRVITPYSAPNFAQLTTCPAPPGAVPEYAAGTYGALSTPQGYVSVEVQATPAAGSLVMTLSAYSSSGSLVVSGTATAASGSWTLLTAAQASGPAAISYFAISSAPSTNSSAGAVIDDLAFGAGNTGGGSGGGGSGGGGSGGGGSGGGGSGGGGSGGGGSGGGGSGGGGSGGGSSGSTTAVGQVLTPSPTAGLPIVLSGAGSSAGSGQIISYDWDFNGDGQTDTSTGTNPEATLILPPGIHNIGLTVTSSNGSQAKTSFPVTVTQTNLKAPPLPDGGTGVCQPSVTIEFVTVLADCIQTDPGGGYVISTAQLSLNGTIMATKSGAAAIFHIKQFNHLGLDYGWQLSGVPVNIELPNTPIGTVVLGGVDLGTNPIDLADHAFVPPVLKFGGLSPQAAAHRLSSGRVPVAHSADAAKMLLFEFAAGQQCDPGSKGATCCPSGAGVSCAQLPGGFPIGGQVAVYTNAKQQLLIDVQVNVQVPDFQATGALEIESDLASGINLNSLQFTIPQAGLAQVFQVKNAQFTYYFPSYPDASKADSWQAKATLTFGPLGQPEIGGELDFLKGQFHYASATITLPPPGVPVYPGVFLTEFGAGVGVNPTVVSGTIGAGFGGSDGLAIELSFKYQDSSSTALGFFGGQGTVKLGGQQIAQIAADVYSDGYVDAAVQVGIKEPQDSPIIQLTGSASFWDEPSSGEWQVTGSLNVTVWIISAEIDALVNNDWIAGCGQVSLGPFTVGAYAAYGWSNGHLDYDTTSNCKNQLKAYQETPTTQHTGGYVGSTRGHVSTRTGDTHGSRVLATASNYGTIRLPSGQLAEELRISSASGTPVVTIQGPGGVDFTTPSQPDQMTGRNGHYIAVLAPVPHQVVVLLEHPAAGQWAITPVAGSPAITNIQNAAQTGPPAIATNVRAGRGRYRLNYRIKNYVAGSSIQFVERGKDSTHVLGTARNAAGTISFAPADAVGRRRAIYATLINTSGAATRTLIVGHYLAAAALHGGSIPSIRFIRRGSSAAVLAWAPARNAREYRVSVVGSDGRDVSVVLPARTRRLPLSQVLASSHFTATVAALGGQNLLAGPARKVALGQAARPVELLSCRKGRCTGELVTGALEVSGAEIGARLSRAGHTLGTGISSDNTGTRLSLRVGRRLPRGGYTLTLSVRRGGHTHTATGKVRIL